MHYLPIHDTASDDLAHRDECRRGRLAHAQDAVDLLQADSDAVPGRFAEGDPHARNG